MEVTRRDLFKFTGLAAAGVVGASALAGCAPKTAAETASLADTGSADAGLPAFLQAPEPITDIAETVDCELVVVGGGNVAMDAARCAKRLGAENVYIVYRRGMAELPARKEEVEHAEEEGIVFKTLTNPTEVLGDENGWVKGMTCVEMELGEPDASGRRRPIVKEGSEFELEVDTMIMALGTSPNPLIRSTTPGLDADKHGCLITNGPDGLTTRPMVYAGGDAVTGAATVILAMGAGKEAARAIDAAIKAKEQ